MEPLVPAGPGEMGLGESISHLMGREGSFDEKIDAARYYKAAGNALLKSGDYEDCLLYTSPSPRDATLSRMPSSA